MANWLHQLQSLLGQQGASPSGESSKGSGLLPGAIGGLAGLLVASKSSRKLLAKYGTSALLAGGEITCQPVAEALGMNYVGARQTLAAGG